MELVLENVTKNFGGLRAVGDVSFSVKDNVIFGLIGPNGAGKTTVFNLITGVYKHDAGTIRFGDKDLAPLKPAQIAGVGIGRTFQNIRLFGQLTVIENLLVACELQKKAGLFSAVLRLPVHYEDEQAMHERALTLLRVFDLHEMANEAPTSLSYGNQRRLEIARAMMLKPHLLLLDEPAAGMNYGEAEGLKTQIRWLRDTFELGVVLVEHNMQVVMGVCEEIHVLDHGETIAHGTAAEIRKHPKVLAAYLGEDEEAPSVRAAVAEAATDIASLAPPSSRPNLARTPSSPSSPSLSSPSSSRPVLAPPPASSSSPLLRPPSQPDARVGPPTPVTFAAARERPASQPDVTKNVPPSNPGGLGDPQPVSNRLSDSEMDDISKGLLADLERGISGLKEAAAAPAPAPAPAAPLPSAPARKSTRAVAASPVAASPVTAEPRPAFTMNEAPTGPHMERLKTRDTLPGLQEGDEEQEPELRTRKVALESLPDDDDAEITRAVSPETAKKALEIAAKQEEQDAEIKVSFEFLDEEDDEEERTKAVPPELARQAADLFDPPTRPEFGVVPIPGPLPPPSLPPKKPEAAAKVPPAPPSSLSNLDSGWGSERNLPAAPPSSSPSVKRPDPGKKGGS